MVVAAESEDSERLPRDRAQDIRENVEFAEELGATVLRPEGIDPLERIRHVVRDRHATQVIASRDFAADRPGLLKRSYADELQRHLPDIEVHLIGVPAPAASRTRDRPDG
jgi:K+-sensing histidine kinase KdpD